MLLLIIYLILYQVFKYIIKLFLLTICKCFNNFMIIILFSSFSFVFFSFIFLNYLFIIILFMKFHSIVHRLKFIF